MNNVKDLMVQIEKTLTKNLCSEIAVELSDMSYFSEKYQFIRDFMDNASTWERNRSSSLELSLREIGLVS